MNTHTNQRSPLHGSTVGSDKSRSSRNPDPAETPKAEPASPTTNSFRFALLWFGLPLLALIVIAYLQRRP